MKRITFSFAILIIGLKLHAAEAPLQKPVSPAAAIASRLSKQESDIIIFASLPSKIGEKILLGHINKQRTFLAKLVQTEEGDALDTRFGEHYAKATNGVIQFD